MSKKILWIDTETTGLNPKVHGLREVACLVEIDGKIVEEFELFIDTTTYIEERYISKYVREVMNVDEKLLISYPLSMEQFKVFKSILDKYIDIDDYHDTFMMSGFNVDFDYSFIEAWFADNTKGEHNMRDYFCYQKLDTLAFVRILKYLNLFETKNNQLLTLCNHFGIELDAHKALDDIKATKKLHDLLVKKYINMEISDV